MRRGLSEASGMPGRGKTMRQPHRRFPALSALCVLTALAAAPAPAATPVVTCGHFTKTPSAAPAPRNDPNAVTRLAEIDSAVRQPYKVLFFGDSLTQRWTPAIWEKDFAPLGVVNGGIDGDRTEHLLWRIDHGNLDGRLPQAVVVLIGTNDLGHGRTPEGAAEGIRADLVRLRERLPNTPILLLGLLPRSDRFGRLIRAVNERVRKCQGAGITYLDIGQALIDHAKPGGGVLTDGVHLTAAGYARISSLLQPVIADLVAGR